MSDTLTMPDTGIASKDLGEVVYRRIQPDQVTQIVSELPVAVELGWRLTKIEAHAVALYTDMLTRGMALGDDDVVRFVTNVVERGPVLPRAFVAMLLERMLEMEGDHGQGPAYSPLTGQLHGALLDILERLLHTVLGEGDQQIRRD